MAAAGSLGGVTYDPRIQPAQPVEEVEEEPPPPYRRIRVMMEIERYRVEGTVTLPPPQGYRNRLSDVINNREGDFIALTEVTITQLDGSETWDLSFAMVARAHIRLIAPIGDDA